jgi:hypothetical protein
MLSCAAPKQVIHAQSSLAAPFDLLLEHISDPKIRQIDLVLSNNHLGSYSVVSSVQKKDENVVVRSHIKDAYGNERDTVLHFAKSDFIKQLNFEKEGAEKQVIIAGSFQSICIKVRRSEECFSSKKAMGLLHLFVGRSYSVTAGQ